jgi:periplasmic copper chaperone A
MQKNFSSILRAAFVACVLLAPGTGAVAAHDYAAGNIVVDHPWARATVGTSRPGGAYLTVINKGKTADRLIAAESSIAARIELHRSVMQDGMMRMLPSPAIDVPAGGEVTFVPGGYHLMLVGLKAPLTAGARVRLTLVFEKAGRVDVKITVMPLGTAPAIKHMAH